MRNKRGYLRDLAILAGRIVYHPKNRDESEGHIADLARDYAASLNMVREHVTCAVRRIVDPKGQHNWWGDCGGTVHIPRRKFWVDWEDDPVLIDRTTLPMRAHRVSLNSGESLELIATGVRALEIAHGSGVITEARARKLAARRFEGGQR